LIVVDTSALMAVVLNEALAPECYYILCHAVPPVISAATLAEVLIVADRRNVGLGMRRLLRRFDLDVKPVTSETAEQAVTAYARWGKGVHPAGLNFADCFVYSLAERLRAPLLIVGRDFARTDIGSAITGNAD
jgi:ribonuclease VapC